MWTRWILKIKPLLNCKHPVIYIPCQSSWETSQRAVSTSTLVMATAMMRGEWTIPWFIFFVGLSVDAGEYAGYRHFRFVSETEVQANFVFVLHTPVWSHPDHHFCSTWGNYHFKTFDGGFLHLPSNCTYTLVRQCKESYEDFHIVIQRQQRSGVPVLKASLKLEGQIVELSQDSITVDNQRWVWVSAEAITW